MKNVYIAPEVIVLGLTKEDILNTSSEFAGLNPSDLIPNMGEDDMSIEF